MKRLLDWFLIFLPIAFVCLALMVNLAGCDQVAIRGPAMTTAENSVKDALIAYNRATSQPDNWTERAYLRENFYQWRFFVRAAKNDNQWGPKLAGE